MYFNIRLNWDPKVIGVKNGIYQVELDKKIYDKKKYEEIKSLFIEGEITAKQEFPEIQHKFYFKKLKSAKKTDIMSFTPNFKHGHFLIEKKTYNLLRQFNIQHHKIYDAVIYDSPNENLDNSYSLFYSVLQDWNAIDFDKTVFTSGGFGNNPIIEQTFTDENDLRKFNGISKVKLLALSKDFDRSLDFFHTRLGGLFVSDRLKVEFEKEKVTGIKFTNEIIVLTNPEI